jgi:RNA polymerase sigma-70 factor (ECF subfamily)
MVPGFADRDDVLQETAVAVIDSFDRYDPNQPFVAWALGIARNQVRLHYRRLNRDQHLFEPATVNFLVDAFVAESAQSRPEFDLLGDCLARLDMKSRELCRLRYELDLKPAAIGQKIGQNANTVAKSLQRIRDRLRDCMTSKAAAAQIRP